eukprot:1512614-Ditylum_brightwellii.AAC.1
MEQAGSKERHQKLRKQGHCQRCASVRAREARVAGMLPRSAQRLKAPSRHGQPTEVQMVSRLMRVCGHGCGARGKSAGSV